MLAIDRKCTSSETLVHVFSRANRKRVGKSYPLIIDAQNSPQDVERALLEFAHNHEVASAQGSEADTLSEYLREALGWRGDRW